MREAVAPATYYRSVAVAARIAAASPYELTLILYEQLLDALGQMLAARSPLAQVAPRSQALALLHGLEQGLDDGADARLAADFRTLFRSIAARAGGDDPSALRAAHADVADLLAMWRGLKP